MRAVVQRVRSARVTVDGRVTGEINAGLLAYIGVERDDGASDVDYMAGKISSLRIFGDDSGKMNLSVADTGGGVLLVSQFTLHGDVRRGRRPSFEKAEAPEKAKRTFDDLAKRLRSCGLTVEEGVFQAHMEVDSVNDGPVTILLDSRKTF